MLVSKRKCYSSNEDEYVEIKSTKRPRKITHCLGKQIYYRKRALDTVQECSTSNKKQKMNRAIIPKRKYSEVKSDSINTSNKKRKLSWNVEYCTSLIPSLFMIFMTTTTAANFCLVPFSYLQRQFISLMYCTWNKLVSFYRINGDDDDKDNKFSKRFVFLMLMKSNAFNV